MVSQGRGGVRNLGFKESIAGGEHAVVSSLKKLFGGVLPQLLQSLATLLLRQLLLPQPLQPYLSSAKLLYRSESNLLLAVVVKKKPIQVKREELYQLRLQSIPIISSYIEFLQTVLLLQVYQATLTLTTTIIVITLIILSIKVSYLYSCQISYQNIANLYGLQTIIMLLLLLQPLLSLPLLSLIQLQPLISIVALLLLLLLQLVLTLLTAILHSTSETFGY